MPAAARSASAATVPVAGRSADFREEGLRFGDDEHGAPAMRPSPRAQGDRLGIRRLPEPIGDLPPSSAERRTTRVRTPQAGGSTSGPEDAGHAGRGKPRPRPLGEQVESSGRRRKAHFEPAGLTREGDARRPPVRCEDSSPADFSSSPWADPAWTSGWSTRRPVKAHPDDARPPGRRRATSSTRRRTCPFCPSSTGRSEAGARPGSLGMRDSIEGGRHRGR